MLRTEPFPLGRNKFLSDARTQTPCPQLDTPIRNYLFNLSSKPSSKKRRLNTILAKANLEDFHGSIYCMLLEIEP